MYLGFGFGRNASTRNHDVHATTPRLLILFYELCQHNQHIPIQWNQRTTNICKLHGGFRYMESTKVTYIFNELARHVVSCL